MSEEQRHQEIMSAFKGIHHRLDNLNGRVYKHEENKADKVDLEKIQVEVNSIRSIVWKMSLVLAGTYGGAELIKSLF